MPYKTKRGLSWLYQTHCPNGHEFTDDNVFYGASGSKCCKICRDNDAEVRRINKMIREVNGNA